VTGRGTYILAIAVGLFGLWAMIPAATLLGTGGLWVMPAGDSAIALTGHLAYQAPSWHWPLLSAPDLAWPVGRSIVMTDSNPAMSLMAKICASLTGVSRNLLGFWLALCWVLQPVAAVYAFRGFGSQTRGPQWVAALTVAGLSILCPAWLMRAHHINLLGHFLLLGCLGLSLRMMLQPERPWWPAALLLCVSILVHPYLFVFGAIVLSAPALQSILHNPRSWPRQLVSYGSVCLGPIGLLVLLGGFNKSGAPGFGTYSMNLLSPFWPQMSGLFGATLPVIDATGGQYEGFNYQGVGVLLLDAAAAYCLLRNRLSGLTRASLWAILIPLGALVLFALTPRVYAGHWLVLPFPLAPWKQIFAALQSSGRAFWLVGYASMLGSVALLAARLPAGASAALFATALALQVFDTAPMRLAEHRVLAGVDQAAPPFIMPKNAVFLRIAPACDLVNAPADLLRLLAIRAGLRLTEVRTARQPAGYDCRVSLSDALERKLAPGELRFFLPDAVHFVSQAVMSQGTLCINNNQGMLCANGVDNTLDGKVATLVPLPSLPAPPFRVQSITLAPLLGFGWVEDDAGTFWSDGSRATLLFNRPAGLAAGSVLELELDVLAVKSGGERVIKVAIDGMPQNVATFTDMQRSRINIPISSGVESLPVRIVFDLFKPLSRKKRALNAPVHQPAMRLYTASIQSTH